MHIHPFSHVNDEFHVRVVVVVCTAGNLLRQSASFENGQTGTGRAYGTYLDVLICHTNVVCVCLQILRCGHDSKLDRPLVTKCLVRPLPNGAYLLDGGDTIVGNEHLHSSSAYLSQYSNPFRF